MSNIVYRRANYATADDRRQILELYHDVYHTDFTAGYDKWFRSRKRKAIGIVAVDERNGKIAGHWALTLFKAVIGGEQVGYRLSLGVMTAADYRGHGIATTLFQYLRQEAIEEGDTRFIMGFPNETSYKMHLGRLNFTFLRDYHFVVLPRGKNRCSYKADDVFYKTPRDSFPGRNHLVHSAEYMEWHYHGNEYDKWQSENGHIFISTRFMDKADIVYWSETVTREELLDFAAFLYSHQDVERVTTWNSTAFLDVYPAEARYYHMCIQYLDNPDAERERIGGEWFFYMGDCDLF